MAAGLGFKTFTTGEVLTAGDVNGYLMQGVLVFASAAARNAAITSPQEGQFAFTKDTNGLWYYDGAAWVASGATGDIEGVTAGIGISGGGTSGTVTVTNSMATAIDAKGDLVAGTGADAFSRLAVGSNNTVLTADSAEATGLKWAAASGGGMTLLSTTTLSGASTSISITPTGYNKIEVFVYGVTASGTYNVFMGINADTTAANYQQFWAGTPSTTYENGANVGVAGVNGILPGVNGPLSSNSNNFWQFTINAPTLTVNKLVNASASFFTDSSTNGVSATTCSYVTTSALSSIQIKTTVNSISGGTCLVFGVK